MIPPAADGVERRWLASGFPSIEEAAPRTPQPVGSLLRELDASLPAKTQLTVLVPEHLDGADAERPVLHRRVDWQIVDGAATEKAPARTAMPRPTLIVRHDDQHTGATRYLRAAAVAWQAASPVAAQAKTATSDIAGTDKPLPATDKPLVWLASGPLPEPLLEWIEDGGTALVGADATIPRVANDGIPLWRDEAGDVLARGLPHGRGRLLQLTKRLAPDAMPLLLDATFPERLWQVFAPSTPLPTRIAARDYAPQAGRSAWPEQPRDLQPWLLLLIAALFLVERWMASGRREVVVP